MTIEKKYKWALAGLIIMVLLNAATLITLWTQAPALVDHGEFREGERGRNAIHQYMKKELGLSDAQSDSLTKFRKAHFREMQGLQRNLQQQRRAYFDFVLSEQAGNAQLRDSLLTQLTGQYQEMEETFFSHMKEMKSVLNEEQQRKFGRLMRDSMMRNRRMEGQHGMGRR